MKKMISLLLVVCLMLALAACDTTPPAGSDPSGTTPPATNDPTGTTPPATQAPTDPPARYEDRISVEAENATDKYVDLEDRTDVNGNPMYQPGNQPHSARPIAEDGYQYVVRSTENIVFCACDWYTYTFEVKEAGTYVFGVRGSGDRDTPVVVYVDGSETAAGTGIFNEKVDGHGTDNYSRYDDSDLITLELTAGTHTIKVAIEEMKNHNFWVDCWWLKPVA